MAFSSNLNAPRSLLSSEEFDLALGVDAPAFDGSDADFNLMRKIETAYWRYTDKLVKEQGFPYLDFPGFIVGVVSGVTLDKAREQCKLYDKFKKSIPTAGTVLVFENSMLLVRVIGSPVWSMPKGKVDGSETLLETAIRETREETGIDLTGVISSETPTLSVQKTTFYLVESDSRSKIFSGYNQNEIVQIGWHQFEDIRVFPERYSKQTRAVHAKLVERGYI